MNDKQLTLRIPEKIKKKLKQVSERKGISVHGIILLAIDEYLHKSLCSGEE